MGLASSRVKRRRTAIDRVPPRPGGEPGTRWPERVAGDFQTPGPNYGANRRSGFSRRYPHREKKKVPVRVPSSVSVHRPHPIPTAPI